MPDPYHEFWGLLQTQQVTPRAAEGIVMNALPLQIRAAGLLYEGNDLKINAAIDLETIFSGDRVLCLSMDEWQTLYILCKVVTP